MQRSSRSASCDDSLRCALSCSPFVSERSLRFIDQRALLRFISSLAVLALAAEVLAEDSSPNSPKRSARLRCAPRRRWSPIRSAKRARYGRGCLCARVHTLRAGVGVVETSLESHLIRGGFTAELLATFTSQLISSRALTKPLNSTAARVPRSDSKPSAGCTASRGAEAN